ncbi:MAG TPA: TraR/DksA family transcriptional regulator [Bacteroidales bacterium]|jgi:DnaK suppressor protein|nr:TraR/DksA family transcriptional regulator [Bacteroidales bacterium]
MNKQDAENIKSKILEEISKTKQSINRFKEMSKPVAPDDAIGRISRMDAINNKAVAEASLRKNREKLKQLEYMLQHIHDNDFGLCASCKTPIPPGRLLLMPQSRYCVNCAN